MFPTTRRRQGLSLLLAATLLLAAAGCGSDGDDDKPESAAASAQGTALKYAKCMRENGIDMPDPAGPDGATIALALPDAADGMEQMNRAIEACKSFQPKAPQMTPEQRQAATDKALELAKCMRKHGVDMPDPTTDGASASMPGVSADDPTFEAAAKACSGPGGTASSTAAVPAQ